MCSLSLDDENTIDSEKYFAALTTITDAIISEFKTGMVDGGEAESWAI